MGLKTRGDRIKFLSRRVLRSGRQSGQSRPGADDKVPVIAGMLPTGEIDRDAMIAHDQLQRQDSVIHSVVSRLEDISRLLSTVGTHSRDFH